MKAHILSVIVLITVGGLLPLLGQNINLSITGDICGGDPDGAISLTVIDGAEPPFSIVWSNADTEEIITPTNEDTQAGTSEITNLEAGTYCVEVISLMYGCTAESCNLLVESLSPLNFINISSSNCICSPGMDGSISVNIAPEQNDNPAVPFTIHATGPEGYNQSHIVWTAAELPYVHTFDNITNEGSYEIVVTNAYGCDINLSIPIVDCEGIFPYIKNLRVMATPASGNPITVYNGNWLQQGDCIAFQGGSIPVQLDNPSTTGLRILFSASEVLDDNTVTISLPGLSSSMVQVNSINTYTYEATFPLLTAADIQGEQQIIIEGATIDGKQLLDLRNMSNDLEDCVQLPQFTDDCSIPTLLEPGADDVHVFEITCMMVDAEITYPSNPDANDGAIELTLGGVPPYSIYWTLGSGTSDPTPYPTSPNAQSIFELKSGEYCVYIKDGNGCRYTNCWSLKPCSPKKLDFKFETICPNDETGEVCGFIVSVR